MENYFESSNYLKEFPKVVINFGTPTNTHIHIREGHARKDKLVRANPS